MNGSSEGRRSIEAKIRYMYTATSLQYGLQKRARSSARAASHSHSLLNPRKRPGRQARGHGAQNAGGTATRVEVKDGAAVIKAAAGVRRWLCCRTAHRHGGAGQNAHAAHPQQPGTRGGR